MKKNKRKMCAWLITMALGLAIVGYSNNKTTTTTETTTAHSQSALTIKLRKQLSLGLKLNHL